MIVLSKTLKELCHRIIGGGTPDTNVSEYWNGSIPWITSADIVDYFTISPRHFITHKGLAESSSNLVPKDNIIIVTRVGVGKLCINPYDVCISQDAHGLILDKEQILPEYLLLYLAYKMTTIKEKQQGSTIKGITRKFLDNIKVSYPENLSDQIEIARDSTLKIQNQIKLELLLSEQFKAVSAMESALLRETFNSIERA